MDCILSVLIFLVDMCVTKDVFCASQAGTSQAEQM